MTVGQGSGRPRGVASAARRSLLALTAAGVLWGSIGVVVRLLQDAAMSTWSIAFWRFACSLLVLIPILGLRRVRTVLAALIRPRRTLAVAGLSLIFQLLYFFSVRDVGAGVATLVTLGLAPLVLYVLEAVLGRAVPPPRTLVVLLLALAGLAVVATGDVSSQIAPRPGLGLLEAVGSGLAYALSTLWSRPLIATLSPQGITFATSALGSVLLVPAMFVVGWPLPGTLGRAGGIVWLGVVTTVIAYGLFYSGLRSTVGSTAMIATLMEPVTAFVLAALLLSEPLTSHNILGGALVLGAVVGLYLRPRRQPRPEVPP